MKHAFLIIAHNEFPVLQRLVSSLDSEQIDFFIHIDKKVQNLPEITTNKSGLFFAENRIDTRWGDVSQIRTELSLFKEAYCSGKYMFYHLISGVHFPIVRTDDILSYYNQFEGKVIFNVVGKDLSNQMVMKVKRYNFFTRGYAYGPSWKRRLCQRLWRQAIVAQDFMHIERYRSEDFYKAPNWISFSEESLKYLIDRERSILKKYRWTFCGDEYFAPTELMSSSLKTRVINSDRVLFQVFGPSSPRILEVSDYETMILSGCLFARKFSCAHSDILDMIENLRR